MGREKQSTKLWRIPRVVQRDGTGCGIACAASLAGTSYQSMKTAALDVIKFDEGFYTDSNDLRKLLAVYRLRLGNQVQTIKWRHVNDVSLVCINWKPRKGTFHWVIYVPDARGGYVRDPRSSVTRAKRRDFDDMRIASYHRITPLPKSLSRRQQPNTR